MEPNVPIVVVDVRGVAVHRAVIVDPGDLRIAIGRPALHGVHKVIRRAFLSPTRSVTTLLRILSLHLDSAAIVYLYACE